MSEGDNEGLVRRYLDEVWNKGNVAAVDEFLAPSYRRHLSPASAPLTRDGQRQRLSGFRAAFPDVHLSVEDVLVAGDRVAFRTLIRGSHRGDLMGIPPTGKAVSFYTVDIVRIEDGKVTEQWGGPDLLSLLQQLGGVVSGPREPGKSVS
jgi:steroid delta-isomerase-like uncharacterized protein